MRIRRVYNHWIPQLLNVGAITLYPFILFSSTIANLKKQKNPAHLFKHEYIHIEQIRKLGWLKFYFLYLVENAKNGYKENKYEVEAYARQSELLNEEEQKAFDKDFGLCTRT